MLWNHNGQLRQADVDWQWVRTKNNYGEKLTLTHIPTGKQVSEEAKIPREKVFAQKKKRDVYQALFDKLEEAVYGPQPKRC